MRSPKQISTEYTHFGAVFDITGVYRYRLWRTWEAASPRLCCLLLNPGSADASRDDPTLRRCVGFARGWGYGGIVMVNLFAFCTSDPRQLKAAKYPIGAENDTYIRDAVCGTDALLVGWGSHGVYKDRHTQISIASVTPVFCLGVTKQQQPIHPLYVPAAQVPVVWDCPARK